MLCDSGLVSFTFLVHFAALERREAISLSGFSCVKCVAVEASAKGGEEDRSVERWEEAA